MNFFQVIEIKIDFEENEPNSIQPEQ